MICGIRPSGEATTVRSVNLWCRRHDNIHWCAGTPLILYVFLLGVVGTVLAQDTLTRARQALDSDQTAAAVEQLELYRQSHANEAEPYNLLGIAYGRAGDDDRSLAMFQEFARLAPNRPEAYNNLGAAYLRKQNNEQAEIAFRHALRLSPQDVNTLYNLGALLNVQHKYSESRPLLARALRRDNSSAVAYEAAVAMAGSGDRKGALRLLNSATPPPGLSAVPWLRLTGTLSLDDGDLVAASKALEEATTLAPEDHESTYALALVRLKQNQPDAAVSLLDKTMGSAPTSSQLVREGALLASYGTDKQALAVFERAVREDAGSYEAWYNLAVLRLEQFKDADGALDAAQHALALKSSGELHNLLGDICETRGHYSDALDHYQQAVRLDPKRDKFAFDFGAELLLHENYDAALTIFRAAEEQFPKSAQITLGLGTAEFMRGKTEDSVSAFLKAVDLDPAFEPAYIFLGEAFSASETHSAEVVAKLADLAGKRPQSFGVQYYYGAALVKEMDHDGDLRNAERARVALRRAAALRPEDGRVYYQLGELCRVEKRIGQAVPYYEKSASLDPNSPEPLYKLGQAYVRLGRQADAKKTFALHRQVVAKAETDLTHRFSEIQSFVLKMRDRQ